MADTKISDMTAATAVTDGDIFPLVQGGANKRASSAIIAEYIYGKKFIETDFLVNTFADLPDAATNTGKLAYVRTTTGTILLLSRRARGFYRSNGTTWDADDLPYRTADTVYTDATGRTILTGDDVQECLGQADTAIQAKADINNPTFTGTVVLPAGQVVNGVTLTTGGPITDFLRGDGTYGAAGGGAVAPVAGRIYRNTNQSIPTGGTFTDVTWNTSAYQANGTFWTTGATVTIPEDGYYQVFIEATFDGTGLLGAATANLQCLLNGATVIGEDEKQVIINGKPALFVMAQRNFTAGDTLKAQVKHTDGGALNLLAQGDHSPDIIVTKLTGAKGDAGASGSATAKTTTITIPSTQGGKLGHRQVITDGDVSPTSKIIIMLGGTVDSDENEAEFLEVSGLSATAGSGNFTVMANFGTRTAGIIKLNYIIGA